MNIVSTAQKETFENYIANLEQKADFAFKSSMAASANGCNFTAYSFCQELEVLRTEIRNATKLGQALGLVGA